ncbi:MAG: hypothetical protein AAGD25_27440 [Cyanobacteria bacterium P01_F01_bin.150]
MMSHKIWRSLPSDMSVSTVKSELMVKPVCPVHQSSLAESHGCIPRIEDYTF